MAENKITPKSGEVISTDRDATVSNFYGITGAYAIRENPNTFWGTSATDKIQEIVAEMEAIDPVLAALFDIVASVLGYPRVIEGKGRIADFVRKQFQRIQNFQIILRHLLSSLKYGFSPIEFVWIQEGTYWVWKKIRDWSPSNFEFDMENRLILRHRDGQKEAVDEDSKFKVLSFCQKYGNRYGDSIYHKLYHHSHITKDQRVWWDIFNERMASPHIVATGTQEIQLGEAKADIKTFMKDLRQWSGLMLDYPANVSLLESKRAAGESYEKLIIHLNREKSMMLTGTPSAAEVLTASSYAKEKETTLLRGDVMKYYIKELEDFVNDTMIPLLVNVNFDNVQMEEMPKWRINVPQLAEDSVKFVESMAMAVEMKKEVPAEWFGAKLGIPEPREGEPILQPRKKEAPPEVNFAGELFKHEAMVWAADKELLKKD